MALIPEEIREDQEKLHARPGQKLRILDVARISYEDYGSDTDQVPELQANIIANSVSGVKPVDWGVPATDERIAVVGYGPSLAHSWEGLKDYKVIITTSKAHDFLVERGIIPTIHIDVDYRSHKAKFLTKPQQGVKYWLNVACSPEYIEKLRDYDLSLFQVKYNNPCEYPNDYPSIKTGLWDVGQFAVYIAKKIGYLKQDLYGFDYSHVFEGKFKTDMNSVVAHAGPHEGGRYPIMYVKAGERMYETNHALLSGCFVFEEFTRNNPDLDLQIYSDALLLNFLEARYK